MHKIWNSTTSRRKHLQGAEKMQALKKRTLPDGRKTWRQVPNQGRELAWMVQAEGGLLVRIKAHLSGACWTWASVQDESLPEQYIQAEGRPQVTQLSFWCWWGRIGAFLGKQFPCLSRRTWIVSRVTSSFLLFYLLFSFPQSFLITCLLFFFSILILLWGFVI